MKKNINKESIKENPTKRRPGVPRSSKKANRTPQEKNLGDGSTSECNEKRKRGKRKVQEKENCTNAKKPKLQEASVAHTEVENEPDSTAAPAQPKGKTKRVEKRGAQVSNVKEENIESKPPDYEGEKVSKKRSRQTKKSKNLAVAKDQEDVIVECKESRKKKKKAEIPDMNPSTLADNDNGQFTHVEVLNAEDSNDGPCSKAEQSGAETQGIDSTNLAENASTGEDDAEEKTTSQDIDADQNSIATLSSAADDLKSTEQQEQVEKSEKSDDTIVSSSGQNALPLPPHTPLACDEYQHPQHDQSGQQLQISNTQRAQEQSSNPIPTGSAVHRDELGAVQHEGDTNNTNTTVITNGTGCIELQGSDPNIDTSQYSYSQDHSQMSKNVGPPVAISTKQTPPDTNLQPQFRNTEVVSAYEANTLCGDSMNRPINSLANMNPPTPAYCQTASDILYHGHNQGNKAGYWQYGTPQYYGNQTPASTFPSPGIVTSVHHQWQRDPQLYPYSNRPLQSHIGTGYIPTQNDVTFASPVEQEAFYRHQHLTDVYHQGKNMGFQNRQQMYPTNHGNQQPVFIGHNNAAQHLQQMSENPTGQGPQKEVNLGAGPEILMEDHTERVGPVKKYKPQGHRLNKGNSPYLQPLMTGQETLEVLNELDLEKGGFFLILSPEVNPAEVKDIGHRGLIAKYIDYLIVENEQITEMSKSVSMPIENCVVDDSYLMDIVRIKVPFPTPRYYHWLHSYYPSIPIDWKSLHQQMLHYRHPLLEESDMYVDKRPVPILLGETFYFFQQERDRIMCQQAVSHGEKQII